MSYNTGSKETNFSRNTSLTTSDLIRIVSNQMSRLISVQDFATAIVNFQAGIGPSNKVRSIATSQALLVTDEIVFVDASGGAKTVTLPDCTTADVWNSSTSTGRRFTIKKDDTSADYNITLATTGSQTIDGNSTYTMTGVNKPFITVVTNGVEWKTVD